ncbi:g10609 [Coccomyxa elongata]
MRSNQVPQQGDAASTTADEKDANHDDSGSHEVDSNAGSKGVSLEDGKSCALARRAAALSKTTSKDSKTGIGGDRADMTSHTSITAVQGLKAADSSPLNDVAKSDPQPVDPKAFATVSSAKGAAQQEAKPSLVDQKRTGDLGSRQKISEPLPHDGGSQEGSEDLGDPDKEHSYPALETPGDEPYDSSQSAFTLGRNRGANSEAGDGVQLTSKDPGDSAAGGKKPGQHNTAGDLSQAGLDGEQSRQGAQSSKEASKSRQNPPGDEPAAGKSAAAAGRGDGGAKDAATLGKVPGGGSEAAGANFGLGAQSGSSKSSLGIGADMAKSDKEPSGNVQGLRDAIALLQRGDVGDGVFELGSEDEEDVEEIGGGGTKNDAAKNTKDEKDTKLQKEDKQAGSSSAKTADKRMKERPSRSEDSSTDKSVREEVSGAERSKQSGADSAKKQEKAGASDSQEIVSTESAGMKEETEANKSADQREVSDRDEQAEEGSEEDRSAPRTFDRLLDHYKLASFLDVPCGDGDQVSSKVDHFPTSHPDDIRYIGVDDSEAAVDSAARVHGDTPNWSFHVQDYVHKALPRADLLVSRAALLRPDMVRLVDMLENFARSGAKYLLLGSFEELTFADPSISTGMESGSGKESDQEGVESEGVPYLVSLQQEPFGLDAPLQVFSEPEGFGAKFGAAAISGSAGESSEGGKMVKSGDDSKAEKNARSSDGIKAGEDATSEKNAASRNDSESWMVKRQMLLYSGEYLMRQNFSLMRGRVELFLDTD